MKNEEELGEERADFKPKEVLENDESYFQLDRRTAEPRCTY